MTTKTKKRIKSITEAENQYLTLKAAINEFLKVKKAQGMSDLTMKDYYRTFNSYMKVSSNTLKSF